MRVLVVEDERQLALQLQAALQAAGFAVDLADNGVDAEHLGSVETYAAGSWGPEQADALLAEYGHRWRNP